MKLCNRLVGIGFVLALAGCGAAAEGEEGEMVGEAHDPLWGYGPAWPVAGTPVCFESNVSAAFRTRVQTALVGWDGPLANVFFSGFGTCPATAPKGQVVVRINPNIPTGTAAWVVNKAGLSTPSGQFGYSATKTSFVEFKSAATPSTAIVLHEFGHVLGFLHQHNDPAPGQPVVCTDRTSVGTNLTGPDVGQSIMSVGYCNTATAPSANDLLGAQLWYRRDADGTTNIHTYNTDPNNTEGDAQHWGNFLMCPGPNDVVVGVEQWESSSKTIQCATAPGPWITDIAGRKYAETTSTSNLCPDGYLAIGVDFVANKWRCSAVSGVGGTGTLSTSNQYGHFQYFGSRTEIHNCANGRYIHGGNIAYNKPITGQGYDFRCN